MTKRTTPTPMARVTVAGRWLQRAGLEPHRVESVRPGMRGATYAGSVTGTSPVPPAQPGSSASCGGSTPVAPAESAGFTLIEVMVVILVLGILAALVAPDVFRHVGTARAAAARAEIEMLEAALDAYRLDNGRYPSTEQGLEALRREPLAEPRPETWRGPYLRKDVPLDPWHHRYFYRFPGDRDSAAFELGSYGSDGRTGGTGDAGDLSDAQ